MKPVKIDEYAIPDINDPEWIQTMAVPAIRDETNPAVRNHSGVQEFLHGLEHDLEAWWKHVAEHGELPMEMLPDWLKKNLPYHPNKSRVTVDVEASEDVRLTTYTIGATPSQAYVEALVQRQDRFRGIITNWGPGIVYISHDTGYTVGNPDVAQIAVGGNREFRTRGSVYAFPSVGQVPVIDVQDEFGYRA